MDLIDLSRFDLSGWWAHSDEAQWLKLGAGVLLGLCWLMGLWRIIARSGMSKRSKGIADVLASVIMLSGLAKLAYDRVCSLLQDAAVRRLERRMKQGDIQDGGKDDG